MPAYLGQHFLKDEGVADAIVRACEIGPEDVVVEIGPGRGILTRRLAGRPRRLIVVEIDEDLLGRLAAEILPSDRIRTVHADFLEWDLERGLPGTGLVKFVGNLPYAVASPILQKVLAWPRTSLAVFMFQKEVCERLTAEPGSKEYGVLTLIARLRAEVEWVALVGRDKFRPCPKVDSGVLRFRPRAYQLPKGVTGESLMRVVKAAFSQRRKQLANPLAASLGVPKERVLEALHGCGLRPQARAEELSLEDFARLARALPPP